jgi:putative colanic acid biosynthesis acetyltransferase WcaF
MKTQLHLYNNSWYRPGNIFKRLSWLLVSAFFFQHPLALGSGFKCFLLRLFGASIGKKVKIKPSVTIKYPWFLKVGDHAWIGEGVWLDCLTYISIGDHCCISQGALLLTGNHHYKKYSFDLILKEIKLEEGVWIGAKAIVCPGVVAGSHAFLTVGSVANSSLEPYTIYRGNPATALKKREITE